jgi:hypothetical protein
MERHNSHALLFGLAEFVTWVVGRWCRGPDAPLGEFVVLAVNLINAERCSGKINWGACCRGAVREWL